MSKFRKRPIVVDAVLFTGNLTDLQGLGAFDCVIGQDFLSDEITIETLEGTMTARPGDWIIKGVKGELYPCKADIFEATYEKATP